MENYYDINLPSFSSLKNLERSPAHYLASKSVKKKTYAMDLGNAIHTSILEPDLFSSRFEIKLNGRSKEGREQAAAIIGTDIMLLKDDDYNNCLTIREHLFKQNGIKNLLTGSAEKEYFYEIDGVQVKSKLDLVTDKYIVDLKTCEDASPSKFTHNFINYHYYAQAYMYQLAEAKTSGEIKPYFIMALEKEPPFEFRIYSVNDFWLQAGRSTIERWISIFKKCTEKNEWPGYERGVTDLVPPQWFINKEVL